MKQQYFILVLAHSLHGRLRRIHVPHKLVYGVLALALVGAFTVAGLVGSYVRMAWKVADYNSLRSEFHQLRDRYQALQDESTQKNEQLATLQIFANEVSQAYGLEKGFDGLNGMGAEGSLLPSYKETLDRYDFLKSARFSIFSRKYPRSWQKNSKPTLWPVDGHFNSYFGKRSDPLRSMSAFHPGVDLSADPNTPVRAAGDGIVTRAGWAGNYGRLIVVDHGGGITTYYGHLNAMDVIAGQEVRRGQLIGKVGRTGRTTGYHLHFEVRHGGSPVNPYMYLKKSARPSNYAKSDLPF